MKLISCKGCGIVLDADVLAFDGFMFDENGALKDRARWDGDGYRQVVPCPVCDDKIDDEGNSYGD